MNSRAKFLWFLLALLCPALLIVAAPGAFPSPAIPMPPKPVPHVKRHAVAAYPVKGAALLMRRSTTATVTLTAAPGITFPAFIYPADMTNYEWTLEFSANVTGPWEIIGGPYGPGLSSGTLGVPCPGTSGFFRMHGVPR